MVKMNKYCWLLLLLLLATHVTATERKYDVVVYGATPSGITAAIAAARQGVSVLIVEPGKFIGGMVTGGLAATDIGNAATIGGIAREFFEKAASRYKDNFLWYAEPHVNLATFREMLAAARVEVVTGERLAQVRKKGDHILSFTTLPGNAYQAGVFIDASYEGDLMAKAGVSYVVGREDKHTYNEEFAGVYRDMIRNHSEEVMSQGKIPDFVHGTPARISALDQKGNLIAGVTRSVAANGSADGLTQSYNFRLTVTQVPSNKLPWTKPADYDPVRYELLLRLIRTYPRIPFNRLVNLAKLANDKFDLNAQGLFSTDYVGGNSAYPDGGYATRDSIWNDHISYTKGFFWFLSQDPRVPERLREETNSWGLCRDEYTDNDNWPYQLYIREARRMKGAYVMNQMDCQENLLKKDAIAMGSFIIDSHIVQRLVQEDGSVLAEGAYDVLTRPYQVPYSCLTPVRKECDNLLVSVCVSASHVAYGSIRMEPVYMMMGHAAGLAATAAVRDHQAVQDISISWLQSALKEQHQVLSLTK